MTTTYFKLPINPRAEIKSHCRLYGDWEIQTQKKIAEGAYGKVYDACRGKDCSHFVAKEILFSEDLPKKWYHRHFIAESLMTQFGGRRGFAVPLYDYFICDGGRRGVMLMEKYDGDLIEFARSELNSQHVTVLLRKIQTMHTSGIWHGDLYTKNVVYKKGKNDIDFRFIDFGLAIPFGGPVPAEARAVDYVTLASSLGRRSLYDQIVAHSVRVNGIEAHNRAVEWVTYLERYSSNSKNKILQKAISDKYGCTFEKDLLGQIPDSVYEYYGPAVHILFAWTTYCSDTDQVRVAHLIDKELQARHEQTTW